MPNHLPYGEMGNEKKVSCPFQMLSVDCMGPFPRSKCGNAFLIVATDYFSKFSFLKPVRQATAQNITSFLENDIFLLFGVPQVLILDNASAHTGKIFKHLFQKYEIPKVWYNCRYHPRNNPVERVNRVIGTSIRSYIKDDQRDWDKEIQNIASALRSSVHEITKFSPSYLVFGRKVPVRGNFWEKSDNIDIELDEETVKNYTRELDQLGSVQENLSKAYENSKRRFDLRRKPHSFIVGENVWRRNLVLSDASKHFAANLAPKYTLCKIKKVRSKVVYELENLDGSDAAVWHIEKLKPYFGSNSDLSNI